MNTTPPPVQATAGRPVTPGGAAPPRPPKRPAPVEPAPSPAANGEPAMAHPPEREPGHADPPVPPTPMTSVAELSRSTHLFLGLCVALVLGFLLWAAIGTLDIVSLTQGEVIPSSHVKEVQHLEGGIVRQILVKEGDEVAPGQPLVELEPTARDADVNEITSRLLALRLERLRWEAEREGADELPIPDELAREDPEMLAQARGLFHSRRELLRSKLSALDEQVTQREKDLEELKARQRNSRKRLELLEEQIRISERLLRSDLTNRYNHLDLLKEQNAIKSQIEEAVVGEGRAEAALKGARAERNATLHAYGNEVGDGLENTRRQIVELTARLAKFTDNLERTVLRSPVSGVVSRMHVTTQGGVIRAGETVLDIVPREDRLVVEARLPIRDIGYVHPGQTATIRLATADAVRFGKLEGLVRHVSPDTLLNDQGQPYYKVRVETPQGYFEKKGERYQLYPGMIVSVQIHTGQRTVLEYIFAPFLTSMDDALTER